MQKRDSAALRLRHLLPQAGVQATPLIHSRRPFGPLACFRHTSSGEQAPRPPYDENSQLLTQPAVNQCVAERTRFELVVRLPVRQFSKLLVSATHPPLREPFGETPPQGRIAKIQIFSEKQGNMCKRGAICTKNGKKKGNMCRNTRFSTYFPGKNCAGPARGLAVADYQS